MNWFQQNRFLGTFLIVLGVVTLGVLYFISSTKSGFTAAKARFDENATELNRLQRLTPFPNEANLGKLKTQAQDYAAEVEKLKEQLKTRVLPVVPMAPNEFQARLRQATTSLTEKARANKVKLPENFFLGFDEFASALPDTAAAPLLGQQLAQVELLLNIMVDARVDSITSLKRVDSKEGAKPTSTPPALPGRKPPVTAPAAAPLVERVAVDAAFVSSPGAARRILNQISTTNQQFFILRTLHVLNEKDTGPVRAVAGGATGAVPAPTPAARAVPGAPPAPASVLNFIVGNERLQTSARIELVRFAF